MAGLGELPRHRTGVYSPNKPVPATDTEAAILPFLLNKSINLMSQQWKECVLYILQDFNVIRNVPAYFQSYQ